ncbi:MAG: 5-formyltetrahydrofolate cyclo-ligase [Oscillospiraceae bacterium]|jgi:5-formyltetrahydrofolate cyclo-ligase|nr:5-formyltetrahydrofolate cyclo-ligase [Oscillospiraceae bacterium]
MPENSTLPKPKGTEIDENKASMRARLKGIRAGVTPLNRERQEREIRRRFFRLPCYKEADAVLCYLSVDSEADTRMLIKKMLYDGKKVYLPRCVPETNHLEFYAVTDLDGLRPGTFLVPEPEPKPEHRFMSAEHPVCVLPALGFDLDGFRLGYGKGCYDRFLSGFSGITVGIGVHRCVVERLPRARHDKPCDIVVTEREVYYHKTG